MFLVLLSIGAINAADTNGTDDVQTVTDVKVLNHENKNINVYKSTESTNSTLKADNSQNDKLSADVGTFTDLNSEIMKSSGSIVLNKDYAYNSQFDSIYAGGFVIDKSITIDFNGHTLNGNYLPVILKVTANNVAIKNVKIKNANATNDNDYPIIWNGNSGTMDNVEISNFKKALQWTGSNGAVKNSLFRDSINFKFLVSGQNFLMNNSRIINIRNPASSGWYILSLTSVGATVSHSRFESCYSFGGVILESGSSMGNILNCVFYNMTATREQYGGAGLYVLGVNYNVYNCYFEKCVSTIGSSTRGGALYVGAAGINTNVKNCTFINNQGHLGGALIINNPAGVVDNCTFINNKATGNSEGGAVYLNGGTLTNSYFEGNTATSGGAIYVSASTIMRNLTFTRNTATSGGAVYVNGQSGVIESSTFNNNLATNGGGVYLAKTKGSVTDSKFYSNTASENGAAIYVVQNLQAHLADNYYSGGSSDVYAIGVTDDSSKKLYISPSGTGTGKTSSSPTNWNNALSHILAYGEIIFTAGTYNLKDIEINIPLTLTAQGTVTINNGHTGCVFIIKSAYVNIRGITFNGNGLETSNAGAIDLNGYFGNYTNCKFTNNYGKLAGAIYDIGGMTAKNHYIDHCTFTGNVAYGTDNIAAGAICLKATNTVISNCIFNNNKNQQSGASALSISDTGNYFTKIINCNFTSNSAASGNYGALRAYNVYGLSLENLRFVGNNALTSGAINWAPQNSNMHISTMNNVYFENNKATNGVAGAVYWRCNYGTMYNAIFKGNSATSYGGALYWNSTYGTIENASFINNL